jgi:hypothetical protein
VSAGERRRSPRAGAAALSMGLPPVLLRRNPVASSGDEIANPNHAPHRTAGCRWRRHEAPGA